MAADPLIGLTINFAPQAPPPPDAPRGGLGSQVLPVAELGDDFDGQPEDGLEYLFLVRREARQHRKGTRAVFVDEEEDDMVVANGPSEVPAAPSNRPSESWRIGFLDQVIALRKRLAAAPPRSSFPPASHGQLPLPKDEPGWKSFINGKLHNPKPTAQPAPSAPAPTSTDLHTTTEPTPDSPPSPAMTLAEAKAAALAALELDVDTPPPPPKPPAPSTQPAQPASLPPTYDPNHPPHLPTPTLLLSLTQPTMMLLLGYITDWLVERQEAYEEAVEADTPSTIFQPHSLRRKPGAKSTPPSSSASTPNPPPVSAKPRRRPPLPSAHELNWILSLLARLDSLQAGDDISTLRSVARTVTEMVEESEREVERWEGGGGRSEGEGERVRDEEDAEGRAKGWMVVACIAGVWKQDDLWNSNL